MELQTTVQNLTKQRHTLRMLGIAYMLFYILAFLIALFSIWAGLLLVVCNGIFFLTVLRSGTKRYQRNFVKNALRFGFCADMTEYSYSGKKEISDTTLYELPLLPSDGTEILCKEGFTAKGTGFTVAGNEISLHYKLSQSEKGKLNYRFVSGTLLEFTWDTACPPHALVTFVDRVLAEPDAMAALLQKDVVEKTLSDPALANQFVLLQPEKAQNPTKGLLRRVKRLAQNTPQGVSVCLQERRLAIFLKDRFYAQKIMVRSPISETALQEQRLPAKNELFDLVRYCMNCGEAQPIVIENTIQEENNGIQEV